MSLLERVLRYLGVYKLYGKWLERNVKSRPVPQHVGVILDGNRRWARSRGLPLEEGYRIGAKKVEELLNWCLKLGIKTLTIYVFSTENFKRRSEEVSAVMKIAEETLQKVLRDERIHRYGVRVKALGRTWLLPPNVQKLLHELEEMTSSYSNYYLNVAIAYGGRAEIIDAIRKISSLIVKGSLKPEDIDEELFEKFLYTSHLPNPHPDLIIRTSGEERLSGFLLWQSAYSELCFLDVYWPEFRYIDLLRAIRTYQKRQRRFGV
ncbi:MAG: polyprenyl diphosphate synthase [Candidatus Nezhaarchaeota archaeon]|nr:polyprenyl diphosphate synthase [Candidatus Nezhaarchaeota archaeon]